jgi:antitoxin YxxD
MSPSGIVDFYLGVNDYVYDERREYYQDKSKLIFFEVSESTFLIMDLTKINSKGQCPIYDYHEKIAESLIDFLDRMDKEDNYYMKQYPN